MHHVAKATENGNLLLKVVFRQKAAPNHVLKDGAHFCGDNVVSEFLCWFTIPACNFFQAPHDFSFELV